MDPIDPDDLRRREVKALETIANNANYTFPLHTERWTTLKRIEMRLTNLFYGLILVAISILILSITQCTGKLVR